MYKIKVTIAALAAALALGAVAANPAFAGWFVEGEELPEGSKAALANTAKVIQPIVLRAPTFGLKVPARPSVRQNRKYSVDPKPLRQKP